MTDSFQKLCRVEIRDEKGKSAETSELPLSQHFEHEGNGYEGAEGSAEIGEHNDEKNPGDLVPPESFDGRNVIEETLKILHLYESPIQRSCVFNTSLQSSTARCARIPVCYG